MGCISSPWRLPEIEFIAGSTKTLAFVTYFHAGKKPFDLSMCRAKFSIISYVNRNGSPLVRKEMSRECGDDVYDGDLVQNVLTVHLDASDTVGLAGQYIYQITIKDVDGWAEPMQGLIKIYSNIDRDYTRKNIEEW